MKWLFLILAFLFIVKISNKLESPLIENEKYVNNKTDYENMFLKQERVDYCISHFKTLSFSSGNRIKCLIDVEFELYNNSFQ